MTADPEKAKQEFDSVMREHGPMIYTLAVRLCGNPVDGQDIAQETFVKAYESFTRFRADSDIRTWLYRICVNLWKNRVRYEKRRFFWSHRSLDDAGPDDVFAKELAGNDLPLGALLESEDRLAIVKKALEALEPPDRAVIVLADMEEATYEGISSLLNIPVGTVKSRLARARQRLRQQLGTLVKEIT